MNRSKFDPIPTVKSPLPLILFAVALVVGGVLISLLAPILLPPQGSVEATQIDGLFQFMLGIGGTIFLLVQALLIYSIFRFRVKDENDTSDGAPFHGNNTLELIWTMIPAVIVIALVAYSMTVWTNLTAPQEEEFAVDVLGRQFAWTFTYQEPSIIDPATGEGVVWSDTHLHVIRNRPVVLHMNASDVNHAFWVPEFRVKQDLLVGRETTVRFTPTLATPVSEDGVIYEEDGFPIRCAELCGGGHGNMSLISFVVVHEDLESYLNYVREATFLILNPPDDPTVLGQSVLESGEYPCAGCHTLSSLGWAGVTAPSLNGIGDRADTRVAGETGGEYIVHSIRHPQRYIVPGYANASPMPQFHEDPATANYMPDDDLIGISAYLYCNERSDSLTMDECAQGIQDVQSTAAEEVTQPGTASQ